MAYLFYLQSSPPFEKGRPGGISESKFQKAKVIPFSFPLSSRANFIAGKFTRLKPKKKEEWKIYVRLRKGHHFDHAFSV
jgi:hypothetical protein